MRVIEMDTLYHPLAQHDYPCFVDLFFGKNPREPDRRGLRPFRGLQGTTDRRDG